MKHLKLLLVLLCGITGILSFTEGAFATSYPSGIAWNNFLYVLTGEEVKINDIGKQIGRIEQLRNPMPKKNGESNDKPVGSLLFEIKGVDTQDVIVVKVDDKFYKASKAGPIPVTTEATTNVSSRILKLSVFSFLVVLFTVIVVWRKKRRRRVV